MMKKHRLSKHIYMAYRVEHEELGVALADEVLGARRRLDIHKENRVPATVEKRHLKQ
jgi:hypothetical protein